MRDLRHGEPCLVRRAAHHHDPVYLHGQRAAEIHREPLPVRWSGYYRDLQREGAIEVVEAETVQREAAELEEQLLKVDQAGLAKMCGDIEQEAASTAATLVAHGAHLQAETCKGAAAAQVAARKARWAQLQVAEPTDDTR